MQEPPDDFDEWTNEDCPCEGCGEEDGQCPVCCGFMYAPGSEQCECCEYERECYEFAKNL